jgi:hypothetical protein
MNFETANLKVGIVGSGFVGASAGYALVMQGAWGARSSSWTKTRPAPRRGRTTFVTPCPCAPP